MANLNAGQTPTPARSDYDHSGQHEEREALVKLLSRVHGLVAAVQEHGLGTNTDNSVKNAYTGVLSAWAQADAIHDRTERQRPMQRSQGVDDGNDGGYA